jgi:hypothetical protein
MVQRISAAGVISVCARTMLQLLLADSNIKLVAQEHLCMYAKLFFHGLEELTMYGTLRSQKLYVQDILFYRLHPDWCQD